MIVTGWEKAESVIADIEPLLLKHWEEVALHREQVPLAPDLERYRRADAAGSLVVVSARDHGMLIGYSVFLLYNHLHYELLVATNDVLFLDREYRSGTTTGLRLIAESEAALERARIARGARQLKTTWHIKPKNDWSPILLRKGYEQEEIILGKLTGEPHGV
jgi:hypothetical protein